MDEAILQVLPQGTKFLSSEVGASSDWTKTSRITIFLPDQSTRSYFLKVAAGETGKTMLRGEFFAASEIYKMMPTFIPQPIAWGELKSTPTETYFILSDYRKLVPDDTLPDRDAFLKRLIELHQRSRSPNGQFGFEVETCDGAVPQAVSWQPNWADLYSTILLRVASLDAGVNGSWAALDSVLAVAISHVIPRLLGTLPANLKPSLIHGDMHEGNMGIDSESGQIIIWDASCFYAHFEMEMGMWRWNLLMQTYIQPYLRLCGGATEPADEFEDRNRLYSVKTKLNYSTDGGEGGKPYRTIAYDDLCFLCKEYAPEIPLPENTTA